MTPVGVEQRLERLAEVAAAAVVGVGPAGTQAVVAVVVPDGRPPARAGRTRGSPTRPWRTPSATPPAGVEVAAVLIVDRLPLDIRHASKIDRAEVAAPGRAGPRRRLSGPAVRVLVTGATGMLGRAAAPRSPGAGTT